MSLHDKMESRKKMDPPSDKMESDKMVSDKDESRDQMEDLEKEIESVYAERLKRLKASRSAKLGVLTKKKNEIMELMENVCNVQLVKSKIDNDFLKLCKEMQELNGLVKDLLCTEDEKEAENDQAEWYTPKVETLQKFVNVVAEWIDAAPVYNLPDKSVGKSRGSVSSKRSRSSVASAKFKLESEKAALLARADMLKKKQALEREEAILKAKEAILKAKKEELELETELAANTARMSVIQDYEYSTEPPPGDGMNAYFDNALKEDSVKELRDLFQTKAPLLSTTLELGIQPQNTVPQSIPQNTRSQHGQSSTSSSTSSREDNMSNLINIMEKQNLITETLVKQQKLSSLPPLSIPTFSGNSLDYQFFIRAFEHCIEEKTEDSKDRLYFLEQCTVGQPRELIRSCQYMQPDTGYAEAKKLLKYHFGDEYQIAMAYIEKALNWSPIKPEDPEALKALAMFLNGCLNTMNSVDYMEEMDHPANMRAVLSKLPYKLKEKWRVKAYHIQERENRRAKFKDLVKFVDKESRILSHPVFGNLNLKEPTTATKTGYNTFMPGISSMKQKTSKSGFATSTSPISQTAIQNDVKTVHRPYNPCVYCQGGHNLSACFQIHKKTHKEKLEFLRSRGLCFGCLEKGHMSKGCQQRLICKECNLKHPTLLHIANKEREKAAVNASSALVYMDKDNGGKDTGAGESEGILAVVPVKLKSKKSNNIVTTYAFLDPGSTATFCTESVLQQLQVTGRRTEILLRTMNKEETTKTSVICDLEICGLESDEYVELPHIFTQNKIPVCKENIPTQEDVNRWAYLREVRIPQIDAEVGLLIGCNVPKALEPWKVINSQGNGPYAVKTILGWTINGPLGKMDSIRTGKPVVMANRISVTRMEDLLQQQIRLDFPEHQHKERMEMSKEDHKFMDSVTTSVKQVEGHYSIGLPLRENELSFPNNRCVAEQRALNLKRKFLRNNKFYKEYKGFMEDGRETVNKLLTQYSQWHRLKKAVVWILRIKSVLKARTNPRKDDQMAKGEKGPLTIENLQEAETAIIQFCQSASFMDEMTELKKGLSVKRSSHLHKLDPILQNNLIRVGGRLLRSAMPSEAKHPVILPAKHHVTQILIRHIHENVGHSGRSYTLSRLRQKYWIPGGNAAIRKVISKCVTCRKLTGVKGEQFMANLPEERVTPDDPPFTNVGMDFFGPFEVKQRRATVKRYGVLFTCLNIRAVHLELANSLNTDSCINAIRRFLARRGTVKVMRSDNGTNLVRAEWELKEAIQGLNHTQIQNNLLNKGIHWIFNPPTGSHHGGIWERQIRSFRRILSALMQQQRLDEDGLTTLFCEVEAIINDRPITNVSNDAGDLEPLTPNHLLLLKTQPSLPPGVFNQNDCYGKRRWRQVQYMADLFWKRWVKEYLPELQKRQKWTKKRRNFVTGDIVLIIDDTAPRNSWIMGKVTQVLPDSRGFVRQVQVRTKTSTLCRPITKLVLLLEDQDG